MHKVTPEKMNEILKFIETNDKGKNDDFPSLDINPYDYSDNGGELEFNVVVYESQIESRIEDTQNYPEEYATFTEERIKELQQKSSLTSEEKSKIREDYIEEVRADEAAEYAVVSEITDGERSAYILYFEQCWGQGGMNINVISGLFKTEAAARYAMNNMEGVIIV